jgi:hypothetical protein
MLILPDIHPCCSPLDIQFQLCCYCCRPRPELRFAGLSDTASLLLAPAVFASPALSQSYALLDPRFCCHALADSRTRRYCSHSLGPRPSRAAVTHWTLSSSSHCWTPACRHSTGPSVGHSSYWTLRYCFAHPDPSSSSHCWTPSFAVPVSPYCFALLDPQLAVTRCTCHYAVVSLSRDVRCCSPHSLSSLAPGLAGTAQCLLDVQPCSSGRPRPRGYRYTLWNLNYLSNPRGGPLA